MSRSIIRIYTVLKVIHHMSNNSTIRPLIIMRTRITAKINIRMRPNSLTVHRVIRHLPPRQATSTISTDTFHSRRRLSLTTHSIISISFTFRTRFRLVPLLNLKRNFHTRHQPIRFTISHNRFLLNLQRNR